MVEGCGLEEGLGGTYHLWLDEELDLLRRGEDGLALVELADEEGDGLGGELLRVVASGKDGQTRQGKFKGR